MDMKNLKSIVQIGASLGLLVAGVGVARQAYACPYPSCTYPYHVSQTNEATAWGQLIQMVNGVSSEGQIRGVTATGGASYIYETTGNPGPLGAACIDSFAIAPSGYYQEYELTGYANTAAPQTFDNPMDEEAVFSGCSLN
jgi:hypothetical protein